MKAARKLHKFIMTDKPDLSRLQHLLHLFLVSLCTPSQINHDPIACPTDQLLLLLSIRPEGFYCDAKTVAFYCCALQYSFRSIVVHIVRLAENGLSTSFEWHENEDQAVAQGDDNDDSCETSDEEDIQDDPMQSLTERLTKNILDNRYSGEFFPVSVINELEI